MFDFKKIKRKMIGGIWIKNKGESAYNYCVNSPVGCNDWIHIFNSKTGSYTGMGRTNVGIEILEDYGKVTLFGKYFGYSETSAKLNNGKSFFNSESFFESEFFFGVIFGLTFGFLIYQ
jgi:hypothetical protein